MKLPAPNTTPDLTDVIRLSEQWVRNRISGNMSSDTEVMIFGPLMQAIYGEDIFTRLDTISLPGRAK
jgi:hypothetical protein